MVDYKLLMMYNVKVESSISLQYTAGFALSSDIGEALRRRLFNQRYALREVLRWQKHITL